MPKNKAEGQNKHAKQRAMERYGIDLNRHKRLEIVHMIQHGKATCVRKQSHRVSIFSLQYENQEIVVVYDKQRKTLASFLPLEAKEEDTFMGNYRWREDEFSEK
jgi:phage FluMu gp28-like protein